MAGVMERVRIRIVSPKTLMSATRPFIQDDHKPNPSRAAPKKRPFWPDQQFFFFGAAWLAKLREPSQAKPKPSRTERRNKNVRLGSAVCFFFGAAWLAKPGRTKPSPAKPKPSRTEEKISPSAVFVFFGRALGPWFGVWGIGPKGLVALLILPIQF